MIKSTTRSDETQLCIERILHSNSTHEEKMVQLEELEPTIRVHYEQGLTNVKPAHLVTADDLV